MSSSGATTNTVTSSSEESNSATGGLPTATPTTPSTSTAVAVVDERASEDALDDVHTRFILNLPPEELASSDRIFFQLEQAYWYYDDFLCDDPEGTGVGSSLRRFSSLRPFAKRMFRMSPVLEPLSGSFEEMWDEFCAYKRRISTYGTIMLNDDCTRLVLCKSFFGEAWTFPAGKVNYGETGVEAGARETYEETGFDPLCRFGLAKTMREEADATNTDLGWSPIRDEDALVYVEENSGKRRTCYVCRGVPEDFPFAPVARKEVSAVEWHDLSDLPKKSYAVLPFVGQLKRWIRRNQKSHGKGNNRQQTPSKKRNENNRTPKRDRSNKRGGGERSANSTPKRDRSNKRGQQKSESSSKSKQKQGGGGGGGGTNSRSGSRSGSRGRNRPGSRGRVREGDAVARTLLAEPGDEAGWSEADMFATNEAMLGRKIEYDGNPHEFTGDDGMEIDPHRFRVVGGTLLNSSGGRIGSSAPPPETSRLQPLFARSSAGGEVGGDSSSGGGGELEPFFSDGGKAPWETSSSAAAPEPQRMERGSRSMSTSIPPPPGGSNDPGMEILNLLRRSSGASASSASKPPAATSSAVVTRGADGVFLTDAEITARSQREKTGTMILPRPAAATTVASEADVRENEGGRNDDLDYMREWVGGLVRTSPSAATELFGEEEFRFDMGPILGALKGAATQV